MPDSRKRTGRKTRQTKDRVLQARIPRHLDDELRLHAEQLGLSVSTVVRNVLLNTFQLVEGVVADSAQIARAMQGKRPRALSHQDASQVSVDSGDEREVIGWQEAVLNRNGVCEACNAVLHRGERAAMGIPVQARPVLLCPGCLGALSSPDTDSPKAGGQE